MSTTFKMSVMGIDLRSTADQWCAYITRSCSALALQISIINFEKKKKKEKKDTLPKRASCEMQ